MPCCDMECGLVAIWNCISDVACNENRHFNAKTVANLSEMVHNNNNYSYNYSDGEIVENSFVKMLFIIFKDHNANLQHSIRSPAYCLEYYH